MRVRTRRTRSCWIVVSVEGEGRCTERSDVTISKGSGVLKNRLIHRYDHCREAIELQDLDRAVCAERASRSQDQRRMSSADTASGSQNLYPRRTGANMPKNCELSSGRQERR